MIKFEEPIDWIKFNANEVGYYRVNYELNEWNILCNLLRCQHEVSLNLQYNIKTLIIKIIDYLIIKIVKIINCREFIKISIIGILSN